VIRGQVDFTVALGSVKEDWRGGKLCSWSGLKNSQVYYMKQNDEDVTICP
jgi:hypothetical protein